MAVHPWLIKGRVSQVFGNIFRLTQIFINACAIINDKSQIAIILLYSSFT